MSNIICHTTAKSAAHDIMRAITRYATLTLNTNKTNNAGYTIYDFKDGWVSDMGNTIEVNFSKGNTYTIIADIEPKKEPQPSLALPEGMDRASAVATLNVALAECCCRSGRLFDSLEKELAENGTSGSLDAYMEAMGHTVALHKIIKANG